MSQEFRMLTRKAEEAGMQVDEQLFVLSVCCSHGPERALEIIDGYRRKFAGCIRDREGKWVKIQPEAQEPNEP